MPKHKNMSNFMYRLMCFWIQLRSIKRKPYSTLEALGLNKGQNILDYGAGPGVYTIAAAKLVGSSGSVYGIDIHPLSKKLIKKKAKNKNLMNVIAKLANIDTGLKNNDMDIVLLFDVIHQIDQKSRLLKELHRVLVTGGKLFIRPDHITSDELKSIIKSDGLFLFKQDHGEILEFHKIG